MSRTLRVTATAAADITEVLARSEGEFGPSASGRCARLIAVAFDQLRAGEPPGSLARKELGPGVRTFHLRLCPVGGGASDRIRTPRHLIAYRAEARSVVVLRLLHERMDLPRQIPPVEEET